MTNQQREAWPAFAGAAEGNLYVGVDPGATGAIAVLYPGNNSVWIGDMPVFHRPGSGSKRDGKKASGSNKLDAGAVMQLLPRITHLTPDEAQRLDVADLVACGLEVAAFLLPKRLQQAPDGPTPISSPPIA